MTDKEAKNVLITIKVSAEMDATPIITHKELDEAFDLAIQALEQQSSDDCISRAYIEPIVEELENICINGDEHILSLLSNIKNAPPVILQQKMGHWIAMSEGFTPYECSECGTVEFKKSKYCPKCGAKMEVEE